MALQITCAAALDILEFFARVLNNFARDVPIYFQQNLKFNTTVACLPPRELNVDTTIA